MKRLIFLVLFGITTISGCASNADSLLISSERFDHILTQPIYTITDTSDLHSVKEALTKVNLMVNQQIEYKYDIDLYGIDDYWASPTEVLKSRKGDCEDYAFLKREILIGMGIPKSRLKLIHVDVKEIGAFASNNNEQHIVLGYYHSDTTNNPILLDNMYSRAMYLRSRRDLHLNYIFDEIEVWETSGNRPAKRVFNTDIIPKFAQLRQRYTTKQVAE